MATLRELYYFDKETLENGENDRYQPEDDESPLQYDDTRKTRLTLRAINKIRKAGEQHNKDASEELFFIRQMYGVPAADGAI